MKTLSRTAVALGFAAAMAIGATAPAEAFHVWIGPHHYGHAYGHRYYNYYGGGYGGCGRPGWTVQGGVCRPYRYGPWDYYR
jgi:hypothetical protein